ncbi:uncharacterized protein LOC121966585, partial [Plectropomus leopardus]|uniref:uncharacterized protein LOC121966585 n=1 Tax=Plectropomus leopardus TaxID=160734 RepID=UPI001C4B793C
MTPGGTKDLRCFGATDHQDVLWLKRDFRHKQEIWSRVFGDNETSVMDEDGGRYQVVKKTSNLHVFNFTTTALKVFMCLLMKQQQCDHSLTVNVHLSSEIIYGSEGQTAVLLCNLTDFSDDQPPRWTSSSINQLNQTDENSSLVFSSLTLNDTAPGPSMVKVRVQHPPEASVKIHQVLKVSGFSPTLRTLSSSSSGSAGAPAPAGEGVQAQTLRGDGTFNQHSGFKYCFREVKDGQ